MPGGAYSVYAAELAEAGQGPVQSYQSANYNIAVAGNTNYMPVTAALALAVHGLCAWGAARDRE